MAPDFMTGLAEEEFLGAAVDTLPSHIAILDAEGTILATNQPWQHFAETNECEIDAGMVGVNYLEIADVADSQSATRAAAGIRAVLEGETEQFELEYPCHSPNEQRWFQLRVVPFTLHGTQYATVTHTDITARKEREQELGYRRALLEAQAETTIDGLLVVDADRSVQYCNDRFLEMWEISPDVAADQSDEKLLASVRDLLAHPTEFRETVEQLYEQPDATSRDTIELTDGRWLDRYSAPVVGDDGTQYGRLWVFRDITERKERERELDRYRQLVDGMLDPAAILDEDGRYNIVNDALAALRGTSSQDLIGKPSPLIRHVRAESEDDPHRELIEGTRDEFKSEFTREYPERGRVTFEYQLSRLTMDNQTAGVIAVCRDITERKEREQKYRRLTERVSDAYYALTSDWTVTYWNDSVAERSGVQPADVVGSNFWEQFPELENTEFEATVREAMASQEYHSCEFHYEPDDYWIELHAYPDDEGISVISQEITERKEREQALAQQRDELAQLQRLNTLTRQITQALQERTTRDAIESAVCERLTDSELYQAVWIGTGREAATDGPVVRPQTAAGLDDAYLEGIPSSDSGPVWAALETDEVQVINDIATTDRISAARREIALAYGHHALAAVPLAAGETTYGVLVVYAPAEHAISDAERAVLADLGQTIALAIQRVHSQRSLTAETVVRLDLRIPDADIGFAEVSKTLGCELTLEQRIPASDGHMVYFITVDDADPTLVCDQLEHGPLVRDCAVIRDRGDDDTALIEAHLETTFRVPLDVLTDYGASVTTARAVDGDIALSVELPPDVHVRTVLRELRDIAPEIKVISKRHVDRPTKTLSAIQNQISDQLTWKQEAALKAAYARGYYEWPRDSTMEEIAETFDITSATLHYRLRRAHQTVIANLFGDDTATVSKHD